MVFNMSKLFPMWILLCTIESLEVVSTTHSSNNHHNIRTGIIHRIPKEKQTSQLVQDISYPIEKSYNNPKSYLLSTDTSTIPINSTKRGSCHNGFEGNISNLNTAWVYNYNLTRTIEEPDNVEFIPMVVGLANINEIKTLPSIPSTLLGFNAPDYFRINVTDALIYWRQLELIVGSGTRLGSPGCTANGISWLDSFLEGSADGYKPRIDFITIHWRFRNASGLLTYLDDLYIKYNKPIWLTEFSMSIYIQPRLNPIPGEGTIKRILNDQEVIDFLNIAIPGLESRPYIERYAWYSYPCELSISNTSLWKQDANDCSRSIGELTPAGIAYYAVPSADPSSIPSAAPSSISSAALSSIPSADPSSIPSAAPSSIPSADPSSIPSAAPSSIPSAAPSSIPSADPSSIPSADPSSIPSAAPSLIPSAALSSIPSAAPSSIPSAAPSSIPSADPSSIPSAAPSSISSADPSSIPSAAPSLIPSAALSSIPSADPSSIPSAAPSSIPSAYPSSIPSAAPSSIPSADPSSIPSADPSSIPSADPSSIPSAAPSSIPSAAPSSIPSDAPSSIPSADPSSIPSAAPSSIPSAAPSSIPSAAPSSIPSADPSSIPSAAPSSIPSAAPSSIPSAAPSSIPSTAPSSIPSADPSSIPSADPSSIPSAAPSSIPSAAPSSIPSAAPSSIPSAASSSIPSAAPSSIPSAAPSSIPSADPSSLPSAAPSSIPSADPSSLPSAAPSSIPSADPSSIPSAAPSLLPSADPSSIPSADPSSIPSADPSSIPSADPSSLPSAASSSIPSAAPSSIPSAYPSSIPTAAPSSIPTAAPSSIPSATPSSIPSADPSSMPSSILSADPSSIPSADPSSIPSANPSSIPSAAPSSISSAYPSSIPTAAPSSIPTAAPSSIPSATPSSIPSADPSSMPSSIPSADPSSIPSADPSSIPSANPSSIPSAGPSSIPSADPSSVPSAAPSSIPSAAPSSIPSAGPSSIPSADSSSIPSAASSYVPSAAPSSIPSAAPSSIPSAAPSSIPSAGPSSIPSSAPSSIPSAAPSSIPSADPSSIPSAAPSSIPSSAPSSIPSAAPLSIPSAAPSSIPSAAPSSIPSFDPSSIPSAILSSLPSGAPSSIPSAAPSSISSSISIEELMSAISNATSVGSIAKVVESLNSLNSSLLQSIGESCTFDSDCSSSRCEEYVCVSEVKICLSALPNVSCSGHGMCNYWGSSGAIVSFCEINDFTCSARCSCDVGYNGGGCELTTEIYAHYDELRASVCDKLQVLNLDSNSSDTNIVNTVDTLHLLYDTNNGLSDLTLSACVSALSNLINLSSSDRQSIIFANESVVNTLLDVISSGFQFALPLSTNVSNDDYQQDLLSNMTRVLNTATSAVLDDLAIGRSLNFNTSSFNISMHKIDWVSLYSATIYPGKFANNSIQLPATGLDSCKQSDSETPKFSLLEWLQIPYPNSTSLESNLIRWTYLSSKSVSGSQKPNLVPEDKFLLTLTYVRDYFVTSPTRDILNNKSIPVCQRKDGDSYSDCGCELSAFTNNSAIFSCSVSANLCPSVSSNRLYSGLKIELLNSSDVIAKNFDINDYGVLLRSSGDVIFSVFTESRLNLNSRQGGIVVGLIGFWIIFLCLGLIYFSRWDALDRKIMMYGNSKSKSKSNSTAEFSDLKDFRHQINLAFCYGHQEILAQHLDYEEGNLEFQKRSRWVNYIYNLSFIICSCFVSKKKRQAFSLLVGGDIIPRFLYALSNYHPFVWFFTFRSLQVTRVIRFIMTWKKILVIMMISAIYFDIYFYDDGSCAAKNINKDICLSIPSDIIGGVSECIWNNRNQSCGLRPPPSSASFIVIVAVFTALIVLPFELMFYIILNDICAHRPQLENIGLNSFLILGSTAVLPSDLILKMDKNDEIKAVDEVILSFRCFGIQYSRGLCAEEYKNVMLNLIRNLGLYFDESSASVKMSIASLIRFHSIRECIAYHIQFSQHQARVIVDNLSRFPNGSSKESYLLQQSTLEKFSFIFQRVLKRQFGHISSEIPRSVNPYLWVLSWSIICCFLLFMILWILLWGSERGFASIPGWGINTVLNIAQEIFIISVLRILFLDIILIEMVTPYLRVLSMRFIHSSEKIEEVGYGETVDYLSKAIENISPTCIAVKNADLEEIDGARLLRVIRDVVENYTDGEFLDASYYQTQSIFLKVGIKDNFVF